MADLTGAELLVQCLEAHGVEYIFGIPGAKIDAVFDALLNSSIRVIICRHEQNAAFMAAAYGRITGKPGIVLVTSGPGVSNLVTGMLTATSEGDPMIAIGGNISRQKANKKIHQSLNSVKLMESVTKSSVEIQFVENIPEEVSKAFRTATSPLYGACFISIPQDIQLEKTSIGPYKPLLSPSYGMASDTLIQKAAALINSAKLPIILLGLNASHLDNTKAIQTLLKKTQLGVTGTYQSAGCLSKELMDCFIGRVGLFNNHLSDALLSQADVVITIGFEPIEYETSIWNLTRDKKIIHLHYQPCVLEHNYQPELELIGDIQSNIYSLSKFLNKRSKALGNEKIIQSQKTFSGALEQGKKIQSNPIHPLRFLYELNKVLDHQTTICCDVGTVYLWVATYLFSNTPHQLLFSNGQQTLGVALPWAMACHLARPNHKIISISGDGGFLFSAMELETAVRENFKLIHFIWDDGSYNLVSEQENIKYHRQSGVKIGHLNIPEFASSFGAIGLELKDPNDFFNIYSQALAQTKPVIINVPIDYSHNDLLFQGVVLKKEV